MGSREDKAKAEVIAKLQALAAQKGTTPQGLFLLYDADHGGELDRSETKALLRDADIGNGLTRGVYVRGIFEALDKDASDGLSLAELDGVLQAGEVPPPGALTREQAAVIARRIAAGEQVDLSRYSQAEIEMIEAANLEITQPIPKQSKVAKLPANRSSLGWVVLALVAVVVLGRG